MVSSSSTPYSQEAEEATIGGLLVSPELFGIVASIITPQDFFIVRHQYIFEAMARINARKEPIDNVTLANELNAQGRYKDIGGGAYLAQLVNNTPTSRDTDIYAQLVKRTAVRRRLLQGADDMQQLAHNEEIPLEDVLAGSEAIMTRIRKGANVERSESWQSIVSRVFDTIEDRMNGKAEAFGVPSGFRGLDTFTTGFKRKSLSIIAGRPGMGKTSLMLSMALNELKLGSRVGFISQEMDKDELCERMMAMEAGINLQSIRTGQLTDREWDRFIAMSGKVSQYPFEVHDGSGMTVTAIRGKALEWMNGGGLDILYGDYLQIFRPPVDYRGNREGEVSSIARGLKDMAFELNIPLVVGAQINRGVENRQDKRPGLADLRESGEIEQAADNVLFIYREDYYEGEESGDTEFILAKQRNGPTGTAYASFQRETTKYTDRPMTDLNDATHWQSQ